MPRVRCAASTSATTWSSVTGGDGSLVGFFTCDGSMIAFSGAPMETFQPVASSSRLRLSRSDWSTVPPIACGGTGSSRNAPNAGQTRSIE